MSQYNYKDKAANVAMMTRHILAKTLSMFEYEGLPSTIPNRELERLLQLHGYAFVTEVNGKLYAFIGGLGGEPDVYGQPTEIVIANPALRFNKTLRLDTDGVLIENDDMRMGLLPLFEKYNTLLAESDINMVMNGYNTRMMTMITTSDDRTREAADRYLKKLVDGELGAVGDKTLFDGIKLQSSNSGRDVITAMIEYHQYLRGSLYHEIGLDAPINMKREQLRKSEVELNQDALYPFVDNMMKCRIEGIGKLNLMYNMGVEVDYGSVWSYKHKETVDQVVVNSDPPPQITVDNEHETPVSISSVEEPSQDRIVETSDSPESVEVSVSVSVSSECDVPNQTAPDDSDAAKSEGVETTDADEETDK